MTTSESIDHTLPPELMGTDLVTYDDTALAVPREPSVVLEEAAKAAAALKGVIDAKKDKIIFNGEAYLEFEDWQTVGRFYGIAPRITSTDFVEYGQAQGFMARAEAVHVPTGRLVSSADAMCLNDEEKWRSRPKYQWCYALKSGGHSTEDPGKDEIVWVPNPKTGKSMPKRERIQTGEESVPLFQLRSMAQTRAAAKALRNALAWVVVLAGYRPTPAEELPSEAAVGPVEATPEKPAVRPSKYESLVAQESAVLNQLVKAGLADALCLKPYPECTLAKESLRIKMKAAVCDLKTMEGMDYWVTCLTRYRDSNDPVREIQV